jgi:LacI family transcriptional regulator
VATIRDVARQAQVSVATVSRVLNNHPSVNPAIRRVVLAAIEALQYQPNPIARTLRTARTHTLGLLLSTMRNAELVAAAIRGAEAAAQARGYALFVANSERDPALEERYLRSMLERRVDGLLCNPRTNLTTVRDLAQKAGVPVVVYGRPAATGVLPTAVLSFGAATEEAIDHLLELGHRRIGTVTHVRQSDLEIDLGWGVPFIRRALRARGMAMERDHHLVVQSSEECTRRVGALFAARAHPTALFVTPLYLVPATIAGIRAAGARVPDDVSLIGFGDSEWAQVVEPPLSVVAADLTAHLDAATRLLIGLIEHGHDGSPVREHRARYLRRDSVCPPPDGDGAEVGISADDDRGVAAPASEPSGGIAHRAAPGVDASA